MRAKEEHAIVLDFLKNGYPEDSRSLHQKEAIVQALGKDHFTLFELVPKPDLEFKSQDEVYVGEGERDQISWIKGILPFDKLTQTAKSELKFVIEEIVTKNEEKFVNFFNYSGPISLRAHTLELLPGIGKRHAKELLEEREVRPFVSFEDVKARVSSVSNPRKLIISRILDELEEKDRFKLFVRV
jgi:putative nucleotide binding protein